MKYPEACPECKHDAHRGRCHDDYEPCPCVTRKPHKETKP